MGPSKFVAPTGKTIFLKKSVYVPPAGMDWNIAVPLHIKSQTSIHTYILKFNKLYKRKIIYTQTRPINERSYNEIRNF